MSAGTAAKTSTLNDQIRAEIQRFESVHPSIYALYDLLDMIPDPVLQQQMRHHVVAIEDSFVNSQEWTVSRSVPDIRLGVVGSLSSGKSALVHRYLTGAYLQEESPEGGRFKKEVVVDGRGHLLLIRDEGGPPDLQFSYWVDAILFVFGLENEASFNAVYHYFTKLTQYRNAVDMPLFLIGCQDNICERTPRVIDEHRARRLAQELKRCSYYETCATYGLNVEKVFRDACLKVVQQRELQLHNSGCEIAPTNSCPPTPSHLQKFHFYVPQTAGISPSRSLSSLNKDDIEDLPIVPTPTATPGSQRKNRRISNIFRRDDQASKATPAAPHQNGHMGQGRAIPIKQGHLYKKSNKTISRESWKKKYVALYGDGRLLYYSSLKDYMEDSHAKNVYLGHVTVKVPREPPAGKTPHTTPGGKFLSAVGSVHGGKDKEVSPVCLTAFENVGADVSDTTTDGLDDSSVGGASASAATNNQRKKKHLRKGSGFKSSTDQEESCCFVIVSLENRDWWFEASSVEERDQWVRAIQQQILNSLQGNTTRKSPTAGDPQALLQVAGNHICADCGRPEPSWCSLNLGALICIDCSGIHRNLGTHISRVRSLQLDQWPEPCLSLMAALGNSRVNRIWENRVQSSRKPLPDAERAEKQRWIVAKYQRKDFLAPLPFPHRPVVEQLIEAILQRDLPLVLLVLAHCQPQDINTPYQGRLPLHTACDLASPEIVQLLIWSQADTTVLDSAGDTAQWFAENSGSKLCQRLLSQAGAANA